MLAIAFLGMMIASYFDMLVVGSDFQAFWSAAVILKDAGPVAVFDLQAQAQAQSAAGIADMIAYVNPPPFLFFVFWLGYLPFVAAWIAWIAVTWLLWFLIARSEWKGDLTFPLIAFPASYIAASHAQNGFLTGALLVGGVLALRRSQTLSGALFGLLIIKPHLALLVPFWLLAMGKWKAIAAAAASALGLILLSVILFGVETWQAYPQVFEVSRVLMAQGPGEFWLRMATPYAALRQHATPEAAIAIQATISLALLAVTVMFARRTSDSLASGAMMLAATAAASPYLFSYDLPFLVVPVFWLIADGRRRGFRPYEKVLVALLYLSPLATRAIALPIEINLMPLAALAMVGLIWNRGSIASERLPPAWREAHSPIAGFAPEGR